MFDQLQPQSVEAGGGQSHEGGHGALALAQS
jgi:hypothetical protein